MKIRVVWLGKTRNAGLAAVCGDMAARIGRFAAFDLSELKDTRVSDDRKRIETEGARILHALPPSDFVVALDGSGLSFTSESFATFISRHRNQNPRDLTFVVGGPAGLSDAVRERADLLWSLSKLTFSHDLARAILLEQIYRALATINNLPYAR
jgi:23S rRNA (pseudouridine1915-N3)-methyltransferase